MTEGKRAVIFVGVILNVLLLNQSVTSNLKAESGINDLRVVSRIYERYVKIYIRFNERIFNFFGLWKPFAMRLLV